MNNLTSVYELAEEFVQLTGCSLFLTGKAGTGKTTFLKRMREQSSKQMAVVAPTGVAAINAGGVTIHSFFQLPFTPYVPTDAGRMNLLKKQQVSNVRRKIFQELELLVIDEISMVRADLLDAIDVVLRHYRHRYTEPFGGVQLIFIGDMYQLSPVVVAQEWELLSQYYESAYFFHAKVMEKLEFAYVELDHIFRQTNVQFIELLNQVRNNSLTSDMLSLLESRYIPHFQPNENDHYITLTTHNQKADVINQAKMSSIEAPTYIYTASVKGEFSEKNYPNDFQLKLKEGAKVMFIANDVGSNRKYYNGKIGVVDKLSDEQILVRCEDQDEPIVVSPETWTNLRYVVNRETNQIEEEELGSYTQFPLRLAWAITIHKSQGLTFDHVIIDAEAAFASGQVYVALSRCRSLDGIVLTSPIVERSLTIDQQILLFSQRKQPIEVLQQMVEKNKMLYNQLILTNLYNFQSLAQAMTQLIDYLTPFADDFGDKASLYWESLAQYAKNVNDVSQKFLLQLHLLFQRDNIEQLKARIFAASNYFADHLAEWMILIEASPVVTDSRSEALDYKDRLANIYEQIAERRHIIVGLQHDFSVNNFFAIKSNFKVPRLSIICYSGDQKLKKTTIKTQHADLYQALAALRNKICEDNNQPVYMVASTKTLVDLSNLLPQTPEQLARVKGFGKVKVTRFGDAFLEIIQNYCTENNLQTASQLEVDFSERTSVSTDQVKKSTQEMTLELCRQGLSLQEVADQRKLKLTTIEKHVEFWLLKGELQIEDYVPADALPDIRDAFVSGQSITEIFASFDGRYTFGQLRMVRLLLQHSTD